MAVSARCGSAVGAVLVQQVLHRVGELIDQGHFDEDEGFHRHARVEKGVAAPVRVEAVLQVLPGADLVHRFVLDQLFQQGRRGLPGEAGNFQEADVEPGGETVLQLPVQGLQFRILVEKAQQGRPAGPPGISPPWGMALNWVRMRMREERMAARRAASASHWAGLPTACW